MTWTELGSVLVAAVAVMGAIITAQRYNTAARSRIYERFDEYKDKLETHMATDYSRKDTCLLRHENIERELKEIKEKTDLIPSIVAQLKVLVKDRNAGEN